LIFESIKNIIENLEKTLKEPENLEYRDLLCRASLNGGIAISQAGTTLLHSLGYPLTINYNISHGQANSIVFKQVYEYNYPVVKNIIDNALLKMNLSSEFIFSFIDKYTEDYKKYFTNLDDAVLNSFSEQVLNSRNMINNPRVITKDEIINIYKNSCFHR